MSGLIARLPRTVPLLGVAFLALVALVATGLLASLDRAATAALWQDAPCWSQLLGERASVLFAAELSLLYALAIGAICLRAGRPLAGFWIVVLLLASVGLEISFKYYFDQPGPTPFLGTLSRPACRESAPSYPLTIVSMPSTLPSGYAIRAAYFCLLGAALIGARWPSLRRPAWIGLGLLAVALGVSRVIVGWHWTSDVVAGLLVGAAAALVALAAADNFVWLRAAGRRVASGRATGERATGRRATSGRSNGRSAPVSRSPAQPARRSARRR